MSRVTTLAMAPGGVALVETWEVRPWSWAPPTHWACLRCGEWFLTRDLQPRCPACGFQEHP